MKEMSEINGLNLALVYIVLRIALMTMFVHLNPRKISQETEYHQKMTKMLLISLVQ